MIGSGLGFSFGFLTTGLMGDNLIVSNSYECGNYRQLIYHSEVKCAVMYPLMAIETFLCLGSSLTFQAENFYFEIEILFSSFLDCPYLYLEFWLCMWWVQRLLHSIAIL